MTVRVCVDAKTNYIDRIFDYSVPKELENKVKVGARVEVPFGVSNKRYIGYIVPGEGNVEQRKLKNILSVLDDEPFIDVARLREAYKIGRRYFSTFADAIKLYMPPGAATQITEEIMLVNENSIISPEGKTENEIVRVLLEYGAMKYDKLKSIIGKNIRPSLNRLEEEGLIKREFNSKEKISEKYITVVSLCDKGFDSEKLGKTASAQRRAINVLRECEFLSIPDLCMFAGCTPSAVRAICEKGIAIKRNIEIKRVPYKNKKIIDNNRFTLTEEQREALSIIRNTIVFPKKPVLLYGITGSGKTEVFIRAIEFVLEKGKGAIVLVPEISLTHQMMGRFIERFGHEVALLHSGLSDGERFDEYKRIREGGAKVVVGARSAVFAPVNNLGLIVVDEEHEDTYKSETGVRYDAREVARIRAGEEGAAVLFASATPSIESFHRASAGDYTLCTMKNRYNGVMLPKTIVADMREELKNGNRSPFSDALKREIYKNLSCGEQTILLLNRRGYSTFVSCRSCGYTESCPNCSISLTYHKKGSYLMCHYCGHKKVVPSICPECGSKAIKGFGTGTQKIEEKIMEEFPGASVIRMDVDTTSKKDSHEKILDSFENEGIDILLGTQMIAKGLDFKNVSLVGVLAADQILNMGDYRAAEKTFNLITQVCGRSGRGDKRGRAVIQTYMPESSTIIYAAAQNYENFYKEEITLRKALCYPPFTAIINVTVTGDNNEKVKNAAVSICNEITEKSSGMGVQVYKAAPCYIDKIKNKYRWHFWLKSGKGKEISELLCEIAEKEKQVSVTIDRNPVSF